MFLYPIKSFFKYNINNKNIIIVGETHINQDKSKTRVGDIKFSEYFINKIKSGYDGAMELPPSYKNNINDIIKTIDSKNIKEILTNAKKNNLINKIHAVDFRTISEFFGSYKNTQIQSMFFNLDKRLMDVNFNTFIKMIDNMMTFINKYYYNQYKIMLEQINPKILEDMFNKHQIIA